MTNPSKSLTILIAFTPLGLIGIDKLYVANYTGNYYIFWLQFVMFILSLFRFMDNDNLSRLGRAFYILNGLFRYLSLFSLITTVIGPNIGGDELEPYLYTNVTWSEEKGDWLLEAISWILGIASICLFFTDFFVICRSWKNDRNKAIAKFQRSKQQNIKDENIPDYAKDLIKKYG